MNISPFDVNYFDFDCIRNILNKDWGFVGRSAAAPSHLEISRGTAGFF